MNFNLGCDLRDDSKNPKNICCSGHITFHSHHVVRWFERESARIECNTFSNKGNAFFCLCGWCIRHVYKKRRMIGPLRNTKNPARPHLFQLFFIKHFYFDFFVIFCNKLCFIHQMLWCHVKSWCIYKISNKERSLYELFRKLHPLFCRKKIASVFNQEIKRFYMCFLFFFIASKSIISQTDSLNHGMRTFAHVQTITKQQTRNRFCGCLFDCTQRRRRGLANGFKRTFIFFSKTNEQNAF